MLKKLFGLQNRSQLKRKDPPVQETENNITPTVEKKSSQPPLVKFQKFQSAWDPTKIHSQTLFVLATRANKVLLKKIINTRHFGKIIYQYIYLYIQATRGITKISI